MRSGFVLGTGATISSQIDLVLCDLEHYPEFSYGPDDGLLLPDSVLGVISVKTSISPGEIHTYFEEARVLKALINDALGAPWEGFYAVIGYWLDGAPESLIDMFYAGVFARGNKGAGVDLLGAIDRGPVCLDSSVFGSRAKDLRIVDSGGPPEFLADRAHTLGVALDAYAVDSPEPFIDMYKVVLEALDPVRLSGVVTLAAPPPGTEVPSGVSTDPAYRAVFAGKSADLVLMPGMSGTFALFYANVGLNAWIRGSPQEVRLVAAGPKDHVPPVGWGHDWLSGTAYCAPSQEVVEPGQIGTFVFNIVAPADARPGAYRFYARPAVTGIGALTRESHANLVRVVTGDEMKILRDGL